jgi:hypothetical protein
MFFFRDPVTDVEQGYVLKDGETIIEIDDLAKGKEMFLAIWNQHNPDKRLELADIDARWGHTFPMPEVPESPELHYWSNEGNGYWDRLEELMKACRRVLPARWGLEEDRSGSWYWYRQSGVHMQAYATPEWEGEPGIPFLRLDEEDTYKDDEQITLNVELTGDVEMDALRIVLKVVNQLERGY